MADNDSFEKLLPPGSQDANSEEGERYSHFRNILMKCTGKCFAPASLEKTSSCFQDIRKKNPEAFDSIIQQLVEGLQANVKQELELMIKQENLVSLFHELDQITATSSESNQAWRPTGRPHMDIKDHILQVKMEFSEKLKDKLKQLQDENKAMQEDLMSMRKEVTDTEERIIQKQKELEKIAEDCHNLPHSNNNNDGLEQMILDLQK